MQDCLLSMVSSSTTPFKIINAAPINQPKQAMFKPQWANWERDILFEKHMEYGNRWTLISKLLPNKTENTTKNYFYSALRRVCRKIRKNLIPKCWEQSPYTYEQYIYIINYLKKLATCDSFPRKSKKKDTQLMKFLSSKDLNIVRLDEYKKSLMACCSVSLTPSKPSATLGLFSKMPQLIPIHESIQVKFKEVSSYLKCKSIIVS